MTKIKTIAIDGLAASGKGSLALALAKHYDFACLQTGLLYRAIAKKTLDKNLALSDFASIANLAKHVQWADMDLLKQDLHQPEISAVASKIATYQKLRDALVDYQRFFAQNPPQGKKGAVLDGRDIGTVILPDADVKFFVIADLEIRAKRRFADLGEKSLSLVKAELEKRDGRDKARQSAPLAQALDAHLLNTTKLSIEETFTKAVKIIEAARL